MFRLLPLSSRFGWAAFAVFFILLSLPALCLPPLWGSSEAREAQVVYSMITSSEYILPLRLGMIPSKPPLSHWISSLLSLTTALSPLLALRGASLLFSVGTLFVTFVVAQSFRQSVNPYNNCATQLFPSLTAFILCSSYLFFSLATDARVDAVYSFFVFSSFAVAFLATFPFFDFALDGQKPTMPLRALIGAAVLSGLGVLAKGPSAAVLPLAWYHLAVFLRLGRIHTRWIFTTSLIWSIVSLLVASPWYWEAYRRGGDAFLGRHLFFENVARVLGGTRVNAQPWWYYFPGLLRSYFPWCLVLLWGAWKERPLFNRERDTASPPWRAPFLGIVAFHLLLVSSVAGKRGSYLLPLAPLLSLLSASYILQYLNGSSHRLRIIALSTKVVGWVGILISCAWILTLECVRLQLFDAVPFSWTEWTRAHSPLLLLLFLASAAISLVPLLSRTPSFVFAALSLCSVASFSHAVGVSLKGVAKQYTNYGEWLRRSASDKKPLYVLKEVWDESFDAMIYLSGHQKVHARIPRWSKEHHTMTSFERYLLMNPSGEGTDTAPYQVLIHEIDLDNLLLHYEECLVKSRPRDDAALSSLYDDNYPLLVECHGTL
jgi:4-amino-4-deoxy-L-arabinose transferase-like glycosyltransferase